jgi:hypothetical protein
MRAAELSCSGASFIVMALEHVGCGSGVGVNAAMAESSRRFPAPRRADKVPEGYVVRRFFVSAAMPVLQMEICDPWLSLNGHVAVSSAVGRPRRWSIQEEM